MIDTFRKEVFEKYVWFQRKDVEPLLEAHEALVVEWRRLQGLVSAQQNALEGLVRYTKHMGLDRDYRWELSNKILAHG